MNMCYSTLTKNSVLWCTVLIGVALLVMPGTACSAEQKIYLEPKLYSFVKYKGDLSHPSWNPRNRSVFYKPFEFGPLGKMRISLKGKRAFTGENVVSTSYRASVNGLLAEDWKALEKLTVSYQRDFGIRKERWSFALTNIPLVDQSDFEDRKVFLYKLVGVDADCKPISLRQNVSEVTSEHLFPDGKSVVLDEFMIDHVICNMDGLSKPGGVYNMVANYQVPIIEVSLYEEKAPMVKVKKKQPQKGAVVK